VRNCAVSNVAIDRLLPGGCVVPLCQSSIGSDSATAKGGAACAAASAAALRAAL
jgi:hypothetical protein